MQPLEQKLTAKQERALIALLSRGEIKAASEEVGISDVTLWRWLQEPGFQSAYRARRRQMVESAVAQLQADCTIAVRVLREVAEDTEAPASARVSAAKTILEQSISGVQLTDLQAEVEELKATLADLVERRRRA